MSIYPNAIDGFEQLPLAIDGVTKINAFSVNNLREAILSIEKELGIRPSSNYSTVRERLDALEIGTSQIIEKRLDDLEAAVAGIQAQLSLDYTQLYPDLADRLDFVDSVIPDEGLYLEAGEDILKGHLLRITNLGKVQLATAKVPSSSEEDIKKSLVVGSVSQKYDDGQLARIYATVGTLINVRFIDPPESTNNGQMVYLSNDDLNPGCATLVRPDSSGTVVFSVGILQGANGSNLSPKVVFQPRLEYYIP